jgi:lysophospholipase L1-like esterase
VVVALALGAASVGLVMPAAAAGHPVDLEYAALGDSYAAGLGLPPYTNQPASGCSQSAANYAHQVASEWDLLLNDASCSGAVAANVLDTPQQTGEGTAPPQSEALNSDTQVVTVSIGGNDLGFTAIAEYCTALSAGGPIAGNLQLDNCRAHFQPDMGTDLLQQRLAEVVEPAVHAALARIVAAAPNAVAIVVGYPAITPDPAHTPASGCFRSALTSESAGGQFAGNAFPFTDVDVRYLHDVEAALNATLNRQARAAGAIFIDNFAVSQGHSACATGGEAYVNGITVGRLGGATAALVPGGDADGRAKPDVDVQPGALHPNSAGMAFLAGQVRSAMLEAFPAPPVPTADPSPSAEARTEWTFPGDLSPATITGAIALLAAAGGVTAFVWRRSTASRTEQKDQSAGSDAGGEPRV